MSNSKRVLILLIYLLFWVQCSPALAGGTFLMEEDLLPILAQNPATRDLLLGSLEMETWGVATRIGSSFNPHFGGRRIGPYRILAKPIGTKGPYTYVVTIETKVISLGLSGKRVDLSKARIIKERLVSVEVNPLSD